MNPTNADTFTTFVVGLASVGVSAFVGWTIVSLIKTREDLARFKLHVAENYTKNADVTDLYKEVRNVSRVVYEIAGKLGVPVRKEE